MKGRLLLLLCTAHHLRMDGRLNLPRELHKKKEEEKGETASGNKKKEGGVRKDEKRKKTKKKEEGDCYL